MQSQITVLFLGLATLAGCGIDAERKPLPSDHPASAQAPEPTYTPPPNLLEGSPLPPVQNRGSGEHQHGEHGGHGMMPSGPVKPYPFDICLVGGEQLGKMGKPETILYEGREIKFCCAACVVTFKKDPTRYLAMLESGGKPAQPPKAAEDPHAGHEEKK